MTLTKTYWWLPAPILHSGPSTHPDNPDGIRCSVDVFAAAAGRPSTVWVGFARVLRESHADQPLIDSDTLDRSSRTLRRKISIMASIQPARRPGSWCSSEVANAKIEQTSDRKVPALGQMPDSAASAVFVKQLLPNFTINGRSAARGGCTKLLIRA